MGWQIFSGVRGDMMNALADTIKKHYPKCYVVESDTLSIVFYKYRYEIFKNTDELYWSMVGEDGKIEVYRHRDGLCIDNFNVN